MSLPLNPVTELMSPQPIVPARRERANSQKSIEIPKDTFTATTTTSAIADLQPIGSQATQIASTGALLTPDQLKAAMRKEKNFNYGTAPAALKQALGQEDADIHASLNDLGKSLYKSQLSRGESQQIALKKGGAATVEYLDQGHTSVVYKLTVGGKSYAMKVFRPGMAGTDVAYRDVAHGAFLNANEVKDASRLYMANPEKNWTLMEHISTDTSLENRTGKTMAELGFRSSDDGRKNRINGILVDHGGTLTVPAEYQADESLFRAALKRIDAPSLLKRLLR